MDLTHGRQNVLSRYNMLRGVLLLVEVAHLGWCAKRRGSWYCALAEPLCNDLIACTVLLMYMPLPRLVTSVCLVMIGKARVPGCEVAGANSDSRARVERTIGLLRRSVYTS